MKPVYLICQGTGMDLQVRFVEENKGTAAEIVDCLNRELDEFEDEFWLVDEPVLQNFKMNEWLQGFRFWQIGLSGKNDHPAIKIQHQGKITRWYPQRKHVVLSSWAFWIVIWARSREQALTQAIGACKLQGLGLGLEEVSSI